MSEPPKKIWIPSNKEAQANKESNSNEQINEISNSEKPSGSTIQTNSRNQRAKNKKPKKNLEDNNQATKNPRKPKSHPIKDFSYAAINGEVTTTTTTTTTTSTSQSKDLTNPKPNKKWQNKHSNHEKEKPELQTFPSEISTQQKESHPSTGETSSLSELGVSIVDRMNDNAYECMICTDTIRRQVAIWSCSNCFTLFHLYCIKKWSRTADDSTQQAQKNISWRCPGCQYIHVTRPIPKCYCGKVVDPPFNPYLIPHSCGEGCGKLRKGTDCPHPCSSVCHPGNCPPCAALGPLKTCFCGDLQYRIRCGQKDPGKSCGEICEKPLSCGKHDCTEICHNGPCATCPRTEVQVCYCGKTKEDRKCGSGILDLSSKEKRYFSCGAICNKLLSCGNHYCQRVCHTGECNQCEFMPKSVLTCPCGKIPLELLTSTKRSSCLDPIKTCPNVCGKLLSCGVHSCREVCHPGSCSECKETIKAPCRCHARTELMPCKDVNKAKTDQDAGFLCNKICKVMRSCGRHPCGNKCCPSSAQADPKGFDPTGAHICNLICDKKLKCGKHKCDLLCGHPLPCPPCHITMHEQYVCECGFTKVDPPILCGTKLPECIKHCVRPRPCGHPSNHLCHSRDSACPPCVVLVERLCIGGHDIRKSIPCRMGPVSCGRTCAKPLICGQHICKRFCHGDACLSAIPDSGSCGQICGKPRSLCEHVCQSACHPDKDCPKLPCKELVRISCPCKRRAVEVECLRGSESDTDENKGVQRELLCDEQCEAEERTRRLAEAFGVSGKRTHALYSDSIIQIGRSNLLYIQKLEKKFEEIIKGPSSKYSFPPSDSTQRRTIHELAKYYNFDTESLEQEPHRIVIVTRRKDSRIPPVLLSVVLEELAKASPGSAQLGTEKIEVPTLYAIKVSDPHLFHHAQHLITFLVSFEGQYHLRWLDDFNALVIFKDSNTMRTSLSYLNGGPFQAEIYKGKIDPIQEVEKAKFVKKPRPSQIGQYKKVEPSWAKDDNLFAIFNETPTTKPQAPAKKPLFEDTKPSKSWADYEDTPIHSDPLEEAIRVSKAEADNNSEKPNETLVSKPEFEDWEDAVVDPVPVEQNV